MILAGFVYTPNDCFVFPSLIISAIKCEDCTEVHGWEIGLNWLWWGGVIVWGEFQDTYG